jgi:hypothetical protein
MLDMQPYTLQFLEKFTSAIQMIEPGDIQVMLPPVDVDITKITAPDDEFLEEMPVEFILPA